MKWMWKVTFEPVFMGGTGEVWVEGETVRDALAAVPEMDPRKEIVRIERSMLRSQVVLP